MKTEEVMKDEIDEEPMLDRIENISKVMKRNIVDTEKSFQQENYNTNAKLNYLSFRQHEENEKLFYSICHQFNMQLTTAKTLIKFDATKGARLLFQRDDIIAEFEDDYSLKIGLCAQVTSEKIFYNYKVDEKCYEELPIKANNNILFLKKGTKRELELMSKEINCNQRKFRQAEANATTIAEFLDNERLNHNNFLNMANHQYLQTKRHINRMLGDWKKQ